MLDVRQDFPFLERHVNGKPVIYLDNAATTQKPRPVIEAVNSLYAAGIANVHRAVNFLADEVTEKFEGARQDVARFINAQANEIIFTGNATHGLNMICYALCRERRIKVLAMTLEHHSNLVPWMQHAELNFVPWKATGEIEIEHFENALSDKPDLVVMAHASNFLGTIQPIAKLISLCRDSGVSVLIDASQSVAHVPLDVRKLDCDYLVFSGHKVYGPSGVGVLYTKHERLEKLRPVLLGGGMVKEVHENRFVLNDLPYRFEAGTPNIEGVVALGAALNYVSALGLEQIAAHENELLTFAREQLAAIPQVTTYGPAESPCVPLIPFEVKGLESTAVAKILGNRASIIVRSGFHCTQPAHDQLGISPTVRASFGLYNSREEIQIFAEILRGVAKYL